MLFKKCLFSLTLALIGLTASHASVINDAMQKLPYGTNLSFIATPVGNKKPLVAYNEKQMMLPASTQKLVTALAALLSLGPDYRFSTTIETTGTINQNTLTGDVVIRFSGDPFLTKDKLKKLFEQLARQGVKQIKGNLIIDTSAYAGHDKAMGWSWNNITACYNAPVSAMIINGNCFYGKLDAADKITGLATVKLKENYPVTVKSKVITIPKKSNNKYCELEITSKEYNRYVLTGCIKQGQKNIPLAFAVQDNFSYTQAIIKNILAEKNIRFAGKTRHNAVINKPLTILAEHKSEPLSMMLTSMLKNSNNMIADTIFRTLGRKYYGVGTWRAGEDAIKTVLLNVANINLDNATIKDGSGLSRQNKITAEKMLELLQYIANNDPKLHIIDMLPISGKDGTLGNRTSLKDKTLTGVITAKTGYLEGSYNLAGFMTTNSGKKIAFVQFINGYSPSNKKGSSKQSAMDFEKQLYHSLYLQ